MLHKVSWQKYFYVTLYATYEKILSRTLKDMILKKSLAEVFRFGVDSVRRIIFQERNEHYGSMTSNLL